MNIIEEGEDIYEKRCPSCNCLFSYNDGDIHKKRDWKGSLGFWSDVYVICPHCNRKIIIGHI